MSSMDPMMGGGTTTLGTDQGTSGTSSTYSSNRVSDTAQQAKEKASELGRNAVEKLDRTRTSAASALEQTASKIRSSVPQSGRVGEVAQRAASGIESAASYMREHDVRDMAGDLEGVVRRNPGPALIVAAAFGFLIGTAMRAGERSSSPYRY